MLAYFEEIERTEKKRSINKRFGNRGIVIEDYDLKVVYYNFE